MMKLSAGNVSLARKHAWRIVEMIEATPEDGFSESELDPNELMDALDRVRVLLNVLEA